MELNKMCVPTSILILLVLVLPVSNMTEATEIFDSLKAKLVAINSVGLSKSYYDSINSGKIEIELKSARSEYLSLYQDKSGDTLVWRVEIKNLKLEGNRTSRDLFVWVGAISGKVLRIYSGIPDAPNTISLWPYYIYLDKRLLSTSFFRAIGYPDSLGQISLLDVIDKSVDMPFDKGEITAYYLEGGVYQDSITRPIWVIDVGGVSALDAKKGKGSDDDLNINHMIKSFDANTGGGLTATYYTAPVGSKRE